MTLFQKIIAGEIPAEKEYEDDFSVAFRDIDPKAPIHLLIVPKRLIARVGAAEEDDVETMGRLLLASKAVAKKLGVLDVNHGYRLVINHGKDAGETVPHMHVHFLAGRPLAWPPG